MTKMRSEGDHFNGVAKALSNQINGSPGYSPEKMELLCINLALNQMATGIIDRLDRIIELLEKQDIP